MAKWDNNKAFENVTKLVDPDGHQPDRLEWERRMFRNLAYFSGIQHFSQDPISGRLWETLEVPGRRRVDFTANMVLPYTTRAVSKLVNLEGSFAVAPNSSERKDKEAAKIAEKFFAYIRHDEGFRSKKERCTMWAACTGMGIMKVVWDPDAGEPERVYTLNKDEKIVAGVETVSGPVAAPPDIPPELRQRKDQVGEFEDVSQGDVSFEVVSPFAFYWDSDAKDGGLESALWSATKTLVDIDKIKDRWPRKGAKVKPDSYASYNTLYEEAIALFHGGQASIGRTVPRTDYIGKDRATVIEYFERGTRANGHKGRYVVIAGKNTVLHNGPNPYVAAGIGLPFVIFSWIPRPGGFVSVDLVGQLTDVQRSYNRSVSHMQDVEATNGFPILVTWKGSGVKSHRIPNYPGAVLEVNPTFGAPAQIPPAPLPPYVGENIQTRLREFADISAQPDVGQGKAPGQVRGSRGIEMLLGEGDQILNAISSSHFDAVAKVGRMALALAGQFYTQSRVIKIIGEGSHWDVMAFLGADLRGNYDVRVTGEPGRIDGAQVRQALIMDLVTAGFLNPQDPSDRQLVLDTLYLKPPDQPFEDLLIDKRNAERENEQLLAVAAGIGDVGGGVPQSFGGLPSVRDFEDHDVHMETHNKMRKSTDYQTLSPQGQKLIDQHVEGHQQYAAQAMQQQLEIQLMMQGGGSTPAPKGEASQPKGQRQQ